MKSNKAVLILIMLLAGTAVYSQTYNSNSGGYNTGYGHMYGSFGMAAASQSMYNSMQMHMQKAMLDATLKKSGGSSAGSSAPTTASATPKRVVRNHGRFTPDASVDTAKMLGDALASNPAEKALLGQIYSAVKTDYDKQAAANGWKNNLAGSLTLFIVSTVTLYHDSAEASEETVKALYEAMNATIDEIPEFGRMSNRDKQAFNNMLIGFAAIPLATYAEGIENGDAATLKAARDLAGQLLTMVLKADPNNIRFENGVIQFSR